MKPIISLSDYKILKSLIQHSSPSQKIKEIALLAEEIKKAEVVDDNHVENDIVRLNSYVEVEDIKFKKITQLTIVLPSMANIQEKKISVLAPISIALLGFKKGHIFHWEMPLGLKQLRILQVKTQPGNA